MLTRLQVKGFKNLESIDVRFGPFTCFLGPNAAGKSNIFDAIRFLSLLTSHPIMEAVRLLRETKGRSPEPSSLFTTFGDYRAERLCFEAEMIVPRHVEDDLGVAADAAITTLRYSVAFRLSEGRGERLELAEESLEPIRISTFGKDLGFESKEEFRKSAVAGVRRGGAFISTNPGESIIRIHQDRHGGKAIPAPKSSRTVLGGSASGDFPTILAAHREMSSWRSLQLEPSAMRAPSFYSDDRFVDARGANLPAALARLVRGEEREDATRTELANRLSELIDDVREVRVRDDEKTESLTLEVCGRDGVFHPARALSDGTLRFLVLGILSLDPEAKGMICVEEPENGIHPERVPAIVRLLRDIAVDPTRSVGPDNPLRQVVINTHSPELVKTIPPDDLLYVEAATSMRHGSPARPASVFYPPSTWRAGLDDRGAKVTRHKLRPYFHDDRQSTFTFHAADAPRR